MRYDMRYDMIYSAHADRVLIGDGHLMVCRIRGVQDFEGGTRVPAFATGGLIPAGMRGTETNEMMHIADWYATFCGLANTEPTDKYAWLGLDFQLLSPALFGATPLPPPHMTHA